MIFFASVTFTQTVHAGPLGFTDTVFPFAQADNQARAAEAITRHYAKKNLAIKKIYGISPAHEQNINRYCFPEAIIS